MCVLFSVSWDTWATVNSSCRRRVPDMDIPIYMFVLPHECVDDISLFEVFYEKCESTMSESIDVAARWTD